MRRRGLFHFALRALLIGIPLTGIIIAVDSSFYGGTVFPSLNIVLYNVISGHGPELYGTEPWHFYILNGILNFNLVFVLVLSSPVIAGLSYVLRHKLPAVWQNSRVWKYFFGCGMAVAIWFGILFTTPHKEERFLFPVYSLLILVAAASLELIMQCGTIVSAKIFGLVSAKRNMSVVLLALLALFAAVGSSRTLALSKFYNAPMEVFSKLQMEAGSNETTLPKEGINVCVGKEWYRFPSSFFLPDRWQLQFIQSDFKGILPKPYEPYPKGNLCRKFCQNSLNFPYGEYFIEWLNIQLIDWLIDALSSWLFDLMVDWLVDWLMHYQVDCSI